MIIHAGREFDGITEADGAAARDRYLARARPGAVVVVDLPADLPCVLPPVFWWLSDDTEEPRALGGGWVGYADGAAYYPAFDRLAEHERWRR